MRNADEKDPLSLLTGIRIKSGVFIVSGKIDAFIISVRLN